MLTCKQFPIFINHNYTKLNIISRVKSESKEIIMYKFYYFLIKVESVNKILLLVITLVNHSYEMI